MLGAGKKRSWTSPLLVPAISQLLVLSLGLQHTYKQQHEHQNQGRGNISAGGDKNGRGRWEDKDGWGRGSTCVMAVRGTPSSSSWWSRSAPLTFEL